MADFLVSFKALMQDEGGYTNNSHDSGGETLQGISRVNQPHWPGWPLVDVHKRDEPNIKLLNENLLGDSQVQSLVQTFYRQRFWQFDALEQDVADKLLSMEVLFGPSGGVRILQQALTRLGHPGLDNGVLDAKTLQATTNAKGPDMMHALRAFEALAHMHHILARPDQIVFAEGWFWRATS